MIANRTVKIERADSYCAGMLSIPFFAAADGHSVKALHSDLFEIMDTSSYRSSKITGFSELCPAKYLFIITGDLDDMINNSQTLLVRMRQKFSTDFTISLSKPRVQNEQLTDAICEAMKALNREFTEGSNSIYFYDKKHELSDLPFPNTVSKINTYVDAFTEAIIKGQDVRLIRTNTDSLFREFLTAKITADSAWQICRDILVCSASKLIQTFKDNRIVTDCIKQEFSFENIFGSLPMIKMKEIFLEKLLAAFKLVNAFVNSDASVVEVLDFLLKTQCANVTLLYVADYLGISASYLSFSFKKSVGIAFKDYVHNYKMKQAEQYLLHSQLKISQIAEKLGYNDLVNFSRNFKKSFGTSPSEYRKQVFCCARQ